MSRAATAEQAKKDIPRHSNVALAEPMAIRERSPIFAGSWDPIAAAHPEFLSYQRTHLLALVLTRVGALPQQAAADAVAFLLSAPDLVVHNPFTNQEGPLRLAVLDITRR